MATARHSDKGSRKIVLDTVGGGHITIYSNQKVLNALEEIQSEMTLYKGVRLLQVIEAAYLQGLKDGTESTLDALTKNMAEMEKLRPRKIGRPAKKAAPRAKK